MMSPFSKNFELSRIISSTAWAGTERIRRRGREISFIFEKLYPLSNPNTFHLRSFKRSAIFLPIFPRPMMATSFFMAFPLDDKILKELYFFPKLSKSGQQNATFERLPPATETTRALPERPRRAKFRTLPHTDISFYEVLSGK